MAEQDRHPYFVFPLLKQLENAKDEESARSIRERIAANVGDEKALRKLLGARFDSFKDFYPDQAPVKSTTDNTIDRFIEKFGGGRLHDDSPLLPETAAPSDYFASLEAEVEKKETPRFQPLDEEEDYDPDEEYADEEEIDVEEEIKEDTTGNLSLEFAKILIKNGNYSKALEIIRDIYLNNPEKSIYFADQIRFIKKLMLNEEKKKLK